MAESPPFYDLGALSAIAAVHFAEGNFMEVSMLSGSLGTASACAMFPFDTKPPHSFDPELIFMDQVGNPNPPGFKLQPGGNTPYVVTGKDLKANLKFTDGTKIIGVGAFWPSFADFAGRASAAFIQMKSKTFTVDFFCNQVGTDPITIGIFTYDKGGITPGAQLDGAPGGATKPAPHHGCIVRGKNVNGNIDTSFTVNPTTLLVTAPKLGAGFTIQSQF